MSIAAAIAVAVALAVYSLSMALARHKPNGILAAVFLAALIAAGGVAASECARYARYGAFYDDAWRDPDVASHFLFESGDTEALQAIYRSDPAAFRPELYDVILVRLGCEDCEKAHARILAAKAEIEAKKGRPAYVVFSRSEIGKLYVQEYAIEGVPVAIVGDVAIPLYS